MNYTKADLRKFFIAGRRYGLTENSENTTMDFDKFFEVYSQIQEDIKEEEKARQKQALIEIMEADAKNGLYDQHKEQWKGWISMKRIEEMKKRDEDKLNQPDKIKVTIKKGSEAGKALETAKAEKAAFRKSVESGKELCDCGKVATWCYMPGYSNDNPNNCDECVPRGCSCNYRYVDVNAYHPPLETPELPEGEEGVDWKWIEQNKVWCYIDEKGREYPCCEHMYSEDGWDIDDEEQ